MSPYARATIWQRIMRPLPGSGRNLFGAAAFRAILSLGITATTTAVADEKARHVATGAQVLAEEGFARLDGARVGLIVNQTSRAGSDHLIDLVFGASNLTLAALFAPEHGLRGDAYAGEDVVDSHDAHTGAPVYSLYGKNRKPSVAVLRRLDALVFDIQDVGARFYTYISTMGLAMQAAARAGVRFVVLDRPNPLGGDYVSGFVMRDAQRSFIGQYRIPIAHGMTIGELALMIKGEALLPGLENLTLEVVPMTGWKRSMRWPDTGVAWVDPSPAIVDFATALAYAGTGLFEATATNYGRGTDEPFRLIGAPWIDGAALARELSALKRPGVLFDRVRFTPKSGKAKAFAPLFAGQNIPGVRLLIADPARYQPVETGIHVLLGFVDHAARLGVPDIIDKPVWLAKMAGTGQLMQMIKRGMTADAIIAAWQDEVRAFTEQRAPYLLYE